LSLLIRGTPAALRQTFHLSACPNLAGHLLVPDELAAEPGIVRGGCGIDLDADVEHLEIDCLEDIAKKRSGRL